MEPTIPFGHEPQDETSKVTLANKQTKISINHFTVSRHYKGTSFMSAIHVY